MTADTAAFACRAAEDVGRFLDRTDRGDPPEDIADFAVGRILAGACGLFDEGDAVEWAGAMRLWTTARSGYEVLLLRILGAPKSGPENARSPKGWWWVLEAETSFRGAAPGS